VALATSPVLDLTRKERMGQEERHGVPPAKTQDKMHRMDTHCIQVYKSWHELGYVFLTYLSLTCFKNTSLKEKKEVCCIVKNFYRFVLHVFYVKTKDAEKHKSRHLFFKFYMKLVVKLFFCGYVNEEQRYKIS